MNEETKEVRTIAADSNGLPVLYEVTYGPTAVSQEIVQMHKRLEKAEERLALLEQLCEKNFGKIKEKFNY